MAIPNFRGKHRFESLCAPEQFLRYMRAAGRLPERHRLPRAAVLLFDQTLSDHAARRFGARRVSCLHGRAFIIDKPRPRVALLSGFGIGAPALAAFLEEMIALGARRFIGVGTAGGLREGMKAGDFVLCSGAIRDEGTSHHYLRPSLSVAPSEALNLKLRHQFKRLRVPYSEGGTWTTDAPYRETPQEVRHYRSLGVATVEMEAAALFAVAKYRGAQAAAVFSISDVLSDTGWNPQFCSSKTKAGFNILLNLAIGAHRAKWACPA